MLTDKGDKNGQLPSQNPKVIHNFCRQHSSPKIHVAQSYARLNSKQGSTDQNRPELKIEKSRTRPDQDQIFSETGPEPKNV